jgi:hypothetical protein
MGLRDIATRLAHLERAPSTPGAPLVLYPLAGESTAAALARHGYRPETVQGRPLILVVYEDVQEDGLCGVP